MFALVLAVLNALRGVAFFSGEMGIHLVAIATYGVFINLILAYFNLIPIPPLDGSHVLYHLLPPAVGARYREMGRYGVTLLFLTVVVFPGAFTALLSPVFISFSWIARLVAG